MSDNVNDNLTIEQVKNELKEYYTEKEQKQDVNHNELECDPVSTRIVNC